MENLYKLAAKEAYFFKTHKGLATIVDLFNLSLEDLNTVGQSIMADIEQDGKTSLISTNTVNPTNVRKLDIVKDIIADRLAEKAAKVAAKDKAEKKRKLLEFLARKQDASLESKTEAELLAELQALDD